MKRQNSVIELIMQTVGPGILLVSLIIFLFSCKKSKSDLPDPPDTDTAQRQDYLVLINPKKITQALPTAPSGNLAINCKDSIFTMKGHPYMARVAVLHDKATVITGFYITVSDKINSYYYDAPPAQDWESSDSTTVVYIGMQPPKDDNKIIYPYTAKIHIQPHNGGGIPVDEFIREITVEDPEAQNKKPLWDEDMIWEWMYSAGWNFQQTSIRQINSPGFTAYVEDTAGGYKFGGCCLDGIYVQAGGYMGAYGICSDTSKIGKQYYKTIWVDGPNNTTGFQYLLMFQSGNFIHYSSSIQYIFHPDKSICAEDDYFQPLGTVYTKTGTYQHTQTSSKTGTLNFKTLVSEPPFGPRPPSGDILFTNHLLFVSLGLEQKYDSHFLRHGDDPIFDIEAFAKDYWQYD
jgi:hypothetical protein